VVGGPSPAWTLKDTQGGTYALQSFPNPILLLFWTRTSWWSLMALRELKEFQNEFQSKGLLILPINVDNTDREATQALTTMGSSVVTLRNTDPNLVMAYGIPLGMYPSTVLIDKDKKIRDVRYGWGNQVKQELMKRIKDLL
jgi:peroxiredoxin